MTKTLLTKIVIGVLATGTVGTVGLVVASKNPTTAQSVKSVPAIAKYVDIVTFNKGLNEEEFMEFMDRAKYLEEPKIKEWKEQHGINNDYNNPDIYSIDQMTLGDINDPSKISAEREEIAREFINWYENVLLKETNKIMIDMYSRASAEQIKAYEDKKQANNTEEQITYMDENGQIVTIKGRENIEEYYRSKGTNPNASMQEQMQQEEQKLQQLEEQLKQEQQTQENQSN